MTLKTSDPCQLHSQKELQVVCLCYPLHCAKCFHGSQTKGELNDFEKWQMKETTKYVIERYGDVLKRLEKD